MLKPIDKILNGITMYRLILYYLIFLFAVAVIFGFLKILPYGSIELIISALVILSTCWITNIIFARVFNAQANIESMYITALILVLIITPLSSFNDLPYSLFLIWASVWAMASKYIFAIRKKHIFNPAAFAVALTAFTIDQSASWWISALPMTPFVLAGGCVIIRKIRRFDLAISFLVVATATILGLNYLKGADLLAVTEKTLLYSPIFFFVFVMITEPLTTPPTKILRICYGASVGFLFAPLIHIGTIYSTPELALVAGNIFSYLISPKGKFVLKLKEKLQIAPDIYDFLFKADREFAFNPGQYMEWTLGHKHPDNRGNRRYFTIASTPAEKEVRLGVKFYPNASSFKKSLASMHIGGEITASQLAGEFVLPRDKKQKLIFIAGGIGITPFRSMIKYLLDNDEKRPIVLFYSNKTASDIVYKDVFDEAHKRFGIKTVYTLEDKEGFLTAQKIIKEAPDYKEGIFYISGPHSMVSAFEKTLKNIGIPGRHIKTDFFPGFV